MKVVKKTGEMEAFNEAKIIHAIQKSADRISFKLTEKHKKAIIDHVKKSIDIRGCEEVLVADLHSLVEGALMEICPKVGKSYAEYRNYKVESLTLFNAIIGEEADLRLNGDKTNANTLSDLIPVTRSLTYKIYAKKMYQNFFLSIHERQQIKDGIYYIHDIGDRGMSRQGIINCCLADVGNIMRGGFELCGVKYAEPKTLATAVNVLMLILNSMAACQYGGYTIESVDEVLGYYAEKSYKLHLKDYYDILGIEAGDATPSQVAAADTYAYKKTRKEAIQGIQNMTYSLATCVSARGDFPFTTCTFALGRGRWETLISDVILEDRITGMGPAHIPAMFPKLVFLYDKNLHGEGKELNWLYKKAIKCQSQTMLPDFLSLSGDGYCCDMYKQFGRTISPMGCRAFLSPWYERGGKQPADENDKPVFRGRGNLGAISLNLPMIYIEAHRTCPEGVSFERHFFKYLKEILKEITNIHIKTFEETAKAKASGNPLGFTQGGFLNGHLKPTDTIREVIKTFTMSYGITALNELQYLHNGKTLFEAVSNEGATKTFAYKVLDYINKFKDEMNEKTEYLFAIYSTPAESLCSTQCKQLEKKYFNEYEEVELDPIIRNRLANICKVGYLNNSFHMAVTENITPIEKQDAEYEFFHKSNGGHIQYVRVPNADNLEANEMLMNRAMEKGYYAGLNLNADFCEDCGERWYPEKGADPAVCCPNCGSLNVTEMNRICGYLGISKSSGGTRIHEGKLKDIHSRKSM